MLPVARSILVAAWRGPPLAVYLLLSGRLERMLDTVLELDSTGLMDDKVRARVLSSSRGGRLLWRGHAEPVWHL